MQEEAKAIGSCIESPEPSPDINPEVYVEEVEDSMEFDDVDEFGDIDEGAPNVAKTSKPN